MDLNEIIQILCDKEDIQSVLLYQIIFYSLRNFSKQRIIDSMDSETFTSYEYDSLYSICLKYSYLKELSELFSPENLERIDYELFETFTSNFIDSFEHLLINSEDEEVLEQFIEFLDVFLFSFFEKATPKIFPETMDGYLNEEDFLKYMNSFKIDSTDFISLPLRHQIHQTLKKKKKIIMSLTRKNIADKQR